MAEQNIDNSHASDNVSVVAFSFGSQEIRTLTVNNNPWFVSKDVCSILAIRTNDALNSLDEDEKGYDTIVTPGGPQEMGIVSESGLYSLILRSRKPEAKKFKKWVTSEVLPSIRKNGAYSAAPNPEPEPERPALAESTPADRKELRDAVDRWVRSSHDRKVNNQDFREAWKEINDYMNVESIKDIPLEHLAYAVQYVEEQIEMTGSNRPSEALPVVQDSRPKDAILGALMNLAGKESTIEDCLAGAKLALLRALYSAGPKERDAIYFAYDSVVKAEQSLFEQEVSNV